ncbi:MAG TPA: hypothetical protein VFS60_02815, partial [Thermoanaerobaculia bacterium]|nr:hypothetical protein [Thermoanaerobaculia bacterium]
MSEPVAASETPAAERDESGRGSGRSRRRTGCLASAVALLLAGAAHWAYWYRARPHELAPADSLLSGESAELPVRLWLPYPHQNLGALGRAVERPQEVLAAAARLAGLPEPTIPRLGAFGIPAARELMVAASRDGRTFEAAIRLYPAAAALTRLAGFVARNPWLAGGEVRVNHAPAIVHWDGLTWRLRAGGAATTGAAPPSSRDSRASAEEAPVLALVDLAEAAPPLAAGRYPLRREDGDLLVRLGTQLPDPPEPPQGSPPPGVMLLWLQRRPERAEALLLLEADREGLLAG